LQLGKPADTLIRLTRLIESSSQPDVAFCQPLMAIPQLLTRADAERLALRGLQSFFNTENVTQLLCERHAVPASQRHFVRLQAESIRYCLQQAMEYREAALAGTFSRPTLVYYSLMSLALTEILFKKDGEFRLAKLRENHAHHGLEFSVQAPASFRGEVALDSLSVRLLQRGTFAVWHTIAKQPGLVGTYVEIKGEGQSKGPRQIGSPGPFIGDVAQRLSLLDLAQSCPAIHAESGDLGLNSQLARASIDVTRNHDSKTVTLRAIVHPTPADVLDKVLKHFVFSPRCIDLVQPFDFATGAGFTLTYPDAADYVALKFPLSYTLQTAYSLFSTEEVLFNEFGIYYLASYISGMFARYYPEHWARALDSGNQTFQVIDSLMSAALSRAPLLLLGELRDRYYIFE
jgi:hypothetical protein